MKPVVYVCVLFRFKVVTLKYVQQLLVCEIELEFRQSVDAIHCYSGLILDPFLCHCRTST